MPRTSSRSNVGEAANRLRQRVLSQEEGLFLGNEDSLERELGVSKPTIRQAARLLEREGLLRVRRGNNGGYFGARPDADFIEATVASYLEVLEARPQELARVATALWVETVRHAAALRSDSTASLGQRFRRKIARLREDAGFSEVQSLEREIREAAFALVASPYVALIFNINANFAHRTVDTLPSADDGTERHRAFVVAWRQAATLLVDAIASGDAELAVLAAKRTRELLHRRIWPDASTATA